MSQTLCLSCDAVLIIHVQQFSSCSLVALLISADMTDLMTYANSFV